MYLNNCSNSIVTIKLSTDRVIQPWSSLKLNDRDIEMFNDLKSLRKDSKLFEEVLKISNFRIEDDSRYSQMIAEYEGTSTSEQNQSEPTKEPELVNPSKDPEEPTKEPELVDPSEDLKDETPEDIEFAAKAAKAEVYFKDLELDDDSDKHQKLEITKSLMAKAAEEGRAYDNVSLMKEVEEAFAALSSETKDPETGNTLLAEFENICNAKVKDNAKKAALIDFAKANNIELVNMKSLDIVKKQIGEKLKQC